MKSKYEWASTPEESVQQVGLAYKDEVCKMGVIKRQLALLTCLPP